MQREIANTEEKDFFPETRIHPSAFISPGAALGSGVVVGPNAVIGKNVRLLDGVQIGAGVVIEGDTTIGDRTQVHSFATLGTAPQDLKYKGEQTKLVIGKDNSIREYVNISIGTQGGGGITRLGDRNLVMVYTHIAHDSQIGNDCIFANGVQIAGHVIVEDSVVFGGMSGGHQFCQFGKLAMVGAGSIVVKDVPPYCMVQGDRARVNGLNVVGLRRTGIRGAKMSSIKQMYKILFRDNNTMEDACDKIKELIPDSLEKKNFLNFLSQTERGICR